jgi:hypothetical protein
MSQKEVVDNVLRGYRMEMPEGTPKVRHTLFSRDYALILVYRTFTRKPSWHVGKSIQANAPHSRFCVSFPYPYVLDVRL